MAIFTGSESELINFIIKNKREPSYVDERKEYQVLLRLRRKLTVTKEKVLVFSSLFEELDKIKVNDRLRNGISRNVSLEKLEKQNIDLKLKEKLRKQNNELKIRQSKEIALENREKVLANRKRALDDKKWLSDELKQEKKRLESEIKKDSKEINKIKENKIVDKIGPGKVSNKLVVGGVD